MGQFLPGVPVWTQRPGMHQLTEVLVGKCGLVTATTNGVHVRGSYHYLGEASDIGDATPSASFAAIWRYLYTYRSHLAELFGPTKLSGGGLFHYGQRFYDPPLQAAHQNHIHVAFLGTSWAAPPSRRRPLADLTAAQQQQLLERVIHVSAFIEGLHLSKENKAAPPAHQDYAATGFWVGQQLKKL